MNSKFMRKLIVSISVLLLTSFSSILVAMEKQYLSFWEILECPSELIEIEGNVRFQFHETGKGWVFQGFWTGEGWGLDTGNEYLITGKWYETVQDLRPFTIYWNDHFQLTGKGEAPNYRFYSRVRFIVDEEGEWVPEFVDQDWPCETVASEIE